MKMLKSLCVFSFSLLVSGSLFAQEGERLSYIGFDGDQQSGILFRAKEPKARLLMIHGLQSHSEWIEKSGTGEALAKAGITTFVFDRRGSGLSQSTPGHAENTVQLLRDIDDARLFFLEQTSDQGDLPLHLLANCFGTRLAVPYVTRNQGMFTSFIMTSPATHMNPKVEYGFLKKLDIKFSDPTTYIDTTLADHFFISSGLNLDWIRQDSLSTRQITASFLWTAAEMTQMMEREIPSLNVPLLVLVASDDVIVENKKIYNEFYLPYKTIPKKYAVLRSEHSLDFGKSKEKYWAEVTEWVLRFSAPIATPD
jgi:alpha-beta hydrolase superfamily lysophospholipase